ncbi:S8 family serine peptidase [Bifidobacterium stellenboschense]|uniref:Subtilisin-type proteinase n=1 Tax=Bifidobacterium stellenboschense TaxID=762211 RepID=A0A087DKS8_9BIFI|nr:S8 family serine peptidase [Bifidobacterium stellenboschense]KFI96128.1 subtilisin-type proteinase [Bifidobacterium stellenboschense]
MTMLPYGRPLPRRGWFRRTAAALAAVAALSALTILPSAMTTPTASAAESSCEIGKTNYITDTPWTESALGMSAVRALGDGSGVTVAVVDSGVDTNNPHLGGDAVLPGVNLAGDGAPDGRTDNYGHGTVIAGIIAARQVNGSSLVGIAPKATILPVRVYDRIDNSQSHSSGGPSAQTLADGIRYAADQGAQIINISQSTVTASATLQFAVQYAQDKGSLVVASAGNRATSSSTQDGVRYPASWPGVLGVAAADTSFHTSADSINGPQVDILAPGMSVTSTIPKGVDCVFSPDAASSSYATAYASGAAALVAQAHPDEGASEWMERIEAAGNRPDPDARDDQRGWGMLNPYGAITITLANGLRGPRDSQYTTYETPPTSDTHRIRVTPSPDPDRPTMILTGIVGVLAVVVTIGLVAVRVARDGKRDDDARSDAARLDAAQSAESSSDSGILDAA